MIFDFKKYTLEQYPKNKDFDISKLNEYHIFIRNNLTKYEQVKTKRCNKCQKELPVEEFYIKDKHKKRRSSYCRDCQLKEAGTIEIGKSRYAKKILNKGFRRCSVCKDIKPLASFSKSITGYNGYSNNCYECSNRLLKKYREKQKDELGDFYIRQYGLRKGITIFNEQVLLQLRNEIVEKNKPKYSLGDNSFLTMAEFALFIKDNYNIPITTTTKRLSEGANEQECTISQTEYRRLKSRSNKGKIKVTDTITGQTYIFFNANDKELLKMFGTDTVSKGIKSGLPIGGKRSKYPNPCIIERIIS